MAGRKVKEGVPSASPLASGSAVDGLSAIDDAPAIPSYSRDERLGGGQGKLGAPRAGGFIYPRDRDCIRGCADLYCSGADSGNIDGHYGGIHRGGDEQERR